MGSQDWSVVDLSDRKLTTISDDLLENAEQVVDLDLSGNPYLEFVDGLCKFKNVKSLRLERCELRRVPEQIFDLRQQEKLILQGNWQLRLTTSIGKLRSLKELDLANCSLSDLPEELWDLTHLEKLSLAENLSLNGLSPSMQKLKCLKDLDIEGCYLVDVPEELWNLSGLEKLNLCCNFLVHGLSSSIQKLQSLKEFRCGSSWKRIHHRLLAEVAKSKLANWISLDLPFRGGYDHRDNEEYFDFGLRILPEALWSLQCLEKLYLCGSKKFQFNDSTIGKLKKLKTLTIRGFGIESLPEDFSKLHDLEVLKLANNKHLQRLCSSFGFLESLKELHITECPIKSLPESFVHLNRLEVLMLKNNKQLQRLCSSFGDLKSLKELHVTKCRIKSLPESFANLHRLEKLQIDCKSMEDVGLFFGQCKTLKNLSISDCETLSLPDTVGDLRNLEILNLHSNDGLTNLCLSFGELSSLKELRITGCQIKSLPESFWTLHKLEILKLSSFKQPESLCSSFGDFSSLMQLRQLSISECPIKSLPESFGKLCRLEILNLYYNNQLESLCSSFGNLSSLKQLDIAGCKKFKSLPESFGELPNLKILDLSFNDQLESLCSSFGNLSSLKQLVITGCDKFKSLPESFGKLPNLEILHMRMNKQLENLCSSFGDLSSLKQLNVHRCIIRNLPETFGKLHQLEILNLDEMRQLDSIRSLCGDLLSLSKLSIFDSQITSLPESFTKLQRLKVLELLYNKQLESLCSSFGDLSSMKELHITRSQINSLPESFGALHNLEFLFLDNNEKMESLCVSFGDLSSLKELHITGCQIKSLPESFGKLVKLEVLKLEYNKQMESLCSSFGDLSSLKVLSIANCRIKSLPESFGKLHKAHVNIRRKVFKMLLRCPDLLLRHKNRKKNQGLEILHLDDNKQLESLCSSFGDLSSLKKLRITGSQIKSLPESFTKLYKLEILKLDNNKQLESLCASFEHLSSLRELRITGCQIKSLPESFGKLPKLEILVLDNNNQLESLCASFEHLSSLKELRITGCQIKSLPESFGKLPKLEVLKLENNKQLESLCSSFGDFSSLEVLSITGCQIKSLPESFGTLHKLEILILDNNNQLENLCLSFGDLSSLRELSISGCQIKSLPESFGKLNKLEVLRYCDNGLQEYPECTIQLKNLRQLDLSNYRWMQPGNSIKKLPATLQTSKLEKLTLYGNPITDPPEYIWRQGIDAIRSHMKEGGAHGYMPFLADCINMLGETGAGKTSISMSLQNGTPTLSGTQDRTSVMDQFTLKIGADFTVRINDFGGHPIYQSVIPIFLPSGGLSIVVYNLEKLQATQEDEVEQWILTAISKSSQVRIVVAGTRSDSPQVRDPLSLKNEMKLFLDNISGKLKQRNGFMLQVENACLELATVSCEETSKDFGQFSELVLKSLEKPRLISPRWIKVMTEVLSFDKPEELWISLSDAEQIYRRHITNDPKCEQNLRIILNYLVNSSLIVWLENHELLNDKIFYSPRKIVEKCKCLFYDKLEKLEITNRIEDDVKAYISGYMTMNMLKYLLKENDVDPLVELLEHFDLLCEIPTPGRGESGNRRFAMAGKLPEKQPEDLSHSEMTVIQRNNTSVWLHLSFHGSIVPKSFFETSLLMVMSNFRKDLRIHTKIEPWHDGLLLIHDSVHLVMKRLNEKPKQEVAAGSSEQQRARKISLSVGSRENHRSPWQVLSRVVKLLHEKIIHSWPGLSPKWEIFCPACKRQEISSTGNEIDYKDLIEINNESIDGTSNFENCVHEVPRILLTPIFKDYTIEQQDRIADFFNNKDSQMQHGATRINDNTTSKLPRIWHEMDDNQLQKRFQSLSHVISTTMTLPAVHDASFKMLSCHLITKGDYEMVLSKTTATDAARTLIVDVIDKQKNAELYRHFLDYLVSIVKTDLERAFTEIHH